MKTYWKCLCAGTLSGMRSLSAIALISRRQSHRKSPGLAASPLAFLASPGVSRFLQTMAIGELGGDKMPKAPARIAPLPLTIRALTGGVAGAALCFSEGERPATGALIGALAAVASSFTFYYARRSAGRKLKLPDSVLGFAEDLTAGALATVVR